MTCADRHVRLELRPLGTRALPAGTAGAGPAGALRGALHHGGAERQLLPLAAGRFLRQLAAPASGGFPPVGQGPARPDARQEALRPRGLDGADRPLLARTRRQAGGAAGPAAAGFRARRRPAGLFPRRAAGLDPGQRRVPPPQLGPPRRLCPPGTARRRVLRDERRRAPLHPPRHRTVRLRPAARTGPPAPLRRFLLGRGPALVGGPDPGMAGGRTGTSSSISTTTAAATPCATPLTLRGLLGA